MFGIIGEDRSDAEMLAVLVKRIASKPNLSVRAVGFSGLGELLNKGARHFRLFRNLGCKSLIACCDADGPDPTKRREDIRRKIIDASAVDLPMCAVVAVQEIEAWIFADASALKRVFSGWNMTSKHHPEHLVNPKERLRTLSRDRRGHARFNNALHNAVIAQYLDLDLVQKRCPSFKELASFVQKQHSQNRHSRS